MKKFFLITLFLPLVGFVCGQVGINTRFPRTVVHLDGAGDNPHDLVTPLTSLQLRNDVVITNQGYVGIGTLNPSVKLEIQTGGIPGNIIKGFKLSDGSEGEGKFLVCDQFGVASWKAAINTALQWDVNRRFTVPHTGIYLITLYLDDNNTTTAYSNKWVSPTLDGGTAFNGVALFSLTRGNYLISNANSIGAYGVSCSGTLVLQAGEVLIPAALAWVGGSTPILGVDIIPL